LTKSDAKTATAIVTDSKALMDDPIAGGFPIVEALKERLRYPDAVAARNGNLSAVGVLNEKLNNPTVLGLHMIQVQRGGEVKKYYLRGVAGEQASTGKVTFKYVSDFELNEKTLSVTKEELVRRLAPFDVNSPQSDLARAFLDMLAKQLDTHGWETVFCDMIDRLLKDREIEPILKILLLKDVMEAGGKGSPALQKSFQRSLEVIEAGKLALGVNWLNPDDVEANSERRKALDLLARLPNLSNLKQMVAAELALFDAPLAPAFEWFGWLKRDDVKDDQWSCRTEKTSPQEADLVVIYRPDADKPVKLERIGRLQKGLPAIDVTEGPALVEGRPIYALPAGAAGK
jgi:hypothetical protein